MWEQRWQNLNQQEDLKALRSWLEKSPHLKEARQGATMLHISTRFSINCKAKLFCWDLMDLLEMFSDDGKLLQFLRGCKFSLERTKEKLDLYNSCRSKLPIISCYFSLWRKKVTWVTQGQPSRLVWAVGPVSTNLPEDSQLQAKAPFVSECSKAVILRYLGPTCKKEYTAKSHGFHSLYER